VSELLITYVQVWILVHLVKRDDPVKVFKMI